ncbi:MAG: matrixin family metalloprotease, partial [Solirubrobacteraceae bacterium]
NAESRWSSPAGGDPSTYSACTIAFSLDARWDWPKLCTVTEHELGHLNGHDHTAEEGDMMSPSYYAPTPECAAATMPGARAARAGARAATARRGRAHARARR